MAKGVKSRNSYPMWFAAVAFMAGLLGDVQTAGNQQQVVQVPINSASVVGKTQQGGETRGVACRRVVPTPNHHLSSLRRVVQGPTYPLNVDDQQPVTTKLKRQREGTSKPTSSARVLAVNLLIR